MVGCIHVQDFADHASLIDCAYCFSPRVEATAPGTIIIDLSGTERLLGNCKSIAHRIRTHFTERGFESSVSIAAIQTPRIMRPRALLESQSFR